MLAIPHSNWLFNQCSHLSAPDMLLSISTGQLPNLSVLRQLAARRMVFVEPDWEIVAELKKASPAGDPWELIPLAAGPNSGECVVNKYNFHRLNSLKQGSMSEAEFPGLKKIGTHKCSMVQVSDLVSKLGIEESGENWLLLEAPGSEWDILDSLRQEQFLSRFSRVIFSAGREAIFEDSQSAEAILTMLSEAGYVQEGQQDDSDPAWPRFHVRLSRTSIECKTLRQESQRYRDEVKQLEELSIATQERLRELHDSLESLETEKQALLSGSEEKERQARELEEKLRELDVQREELHILLEQREKEVEETRNESRQQFNILNERNEKLLDNLSVAVKVQALREADLRELQERYKHINEANRRQVELLNKLRQRLGAASEYLKQLNLQENDAYREELTFNLVRALTGEDEST